jgi:hypothetical protein
LRSDRCKRGFQGETVNSLPPVALVDHETWNSPQLLCAIGREPAIIGIVVDTRQFLAKAVLTPAHSLAVEVDENAMRLAVLN